MNASRAHRPKQITDVYLVALAARHAGTFATLDGRVRIDAVLAAQPANLSVI